LRGKQALFGREIWIKALGVFSKYGKVMSCRGSSRK
jgi:hypothetical protein